MDFKIEVFDHDWSNGVLRGRIPVINGDKSRRHGLCTWWDEKGNMESFEHYIDGKLNGVCLYGDNQYEKTHELSTYVFDEEHGIKIHLYC